MIGLYLLLFIPTLTLEEAKDILLDRSPILESAKIDVEIAMEKYHQMKASFYPSVTLQSSYTRLTNVPVVEMQTPQGTMEMSMGWPDNYQNALSISLPLFTSGKRLIMNKLGEIGVETAELQRQQLERKMIDNLAQIYFGLLMSQKAKELSSEALENAQEHYNVTEAQFKEGSATDLDVIRAEKDVYQAKSNILQADNNIKSLYRALNNLLGFPVDTIYPLEDGGDSLGIDIPVDSLVELALNTREELKSIDRAIGIAKLNIKMNFASFLPDIAFWSNIGYNKPINFDNKWGWDVKMGVSLSLPIFQGFSNYHKLKEAKRNLEKLLITRDMAKKNLEIEIRDLYDRLEEAREELKVQEENLKLSKRALEMAKEQYRMGYITHTDYRDIELGYMGAQFSYYSALFKFRINLEKIKNAIRR